MRETTRNGPGRGYRRRWKRAPVEKRRAAAASLGDVFASRRVRGLLWAALILSVAVHGVTVPLLGRGLQGGAGLAAAEGSYLQRVMQKERAKRVSKKIKDMITMPPPPPEPEVVVERALDESLTSDVAKVTAGLLNVELQNELTHYVSTNLKDELAAAARDIATGKLSEDEIEALHRKFQDKAHEMTVQWRQEYLEKTQLERAAMSTTEWYESEVSRTLVNNMYYELFLRPHNPAWRFYVRVTGRAQGRDAFIIASRDFGNRLGLFDLAVAGRRHIEDAPDASWPGANPEQAKWLRQRLTELCNGTEMRYRHNYAPEASVRQLLDFHITMYVPHRTDDAEKIRAGLKAAQEEAVAAAEAYVAKAEAGADAKALAAARDAVFAGFKAVASAAGSVHALHLKRSEGDYDGLNRSVKTEIMAGPTRETVYKRWIDILVDGLEPMVRDFARGQFKKGIIVHKDGVDEAMKEFPRTVVPLLRRDMMRLIPQKRFYEICFDPYQHHSEVTEQRGPPNEAEVQAERKMVADAVAAGGDAKAYVECRRAEIAAQWGQAVDELGEEMLTRVLTGNLLFRNMGVFVEGVDYSDKVQEKLDARAAALKGRGQDLAKLTDDGVPDTSAPLVAMIFGASKGHGANLEPVVTAMTPRTMALYDRPQAILTGGPFQPPPAPRPWGFEEQPTVEATFANSPRFEGIPFLTKFPNLDGSLSDWGRIRPLILRARQGGPAVLVYAAWNYQGFFFGYSVQQDIERFYYPSLWQQLGNHNTGDIGYSKVAGVDWAYRGDYLQLLFDTLDARNDNRGEPHTQEFVVFPRGTESDPTLPGIERVIASQRDAQTKEYRGVKSTCTIFPAQPPAANGPDGSGPYRVTRFHEKGYTCEVFIPRTLFKSPVFAPGWYLGFNVAVGIGVQGPYRQFRGQAWSSDDRDRADRPASWGDLLLLGTDPQIAVQLAREGWPPATAVTPGYSYLLTVADPDRNVSPAVEDTVLVSAEVGDHGGREVPGADVEVYVLKETGKNTGLFRGFVDTQPGSGRQVQAVLELMPLQEVRFGYVDFANAKGQRNVINEMRLPVAAPVSRAIGVASAAQ